MTTIDDLIERNQRAGCHFFSDGAMKFFKSIVYPKVFEGDIFITSEKQEHANYRAAERHALREVKEAAK